MCYNYIVGKFREKGSGVLPILISNNPDVASHFSAIYQVEIYEAATPLEILQKARNLVHLGHGLLTHPLAGSLPAGLSPFKSVVLTAAPLAPAPDVNIINIIEGAVNTYSKVVFGVYCEENNKDFSAIDLALIKGGIR